MSHGKAPEWVFDPVPPSGALSGGDPTSYVFSPDIDTLVREVVQNATDQQSGDAPVKVSFSLHELTDDARASFLEGLGWSVLREHLVGVANSASLINGRVRDALAEIDSGRLLVLQIEDSGTKGPSGDGWAVARLPAYRRTRTARAPGPCHEISVRSTRVRRGTWCARCAGAHVAKRHKARPDPKGRTPLWVDPPSLGRFPNCPTATGRSPRPRPSRGRCPQMWTPVVRLTPPSTSMPRSSSGARLRRARTARALDTSHELSVRSTRVCRGTWCARCAGAHTA